MLTSVKAIIFDMDGVIFDSERIYYDAFFAAADKHEIEVNESFVHDFAGKSTDVCLLMLQGFFNNDIEKTQYFARDWAEARADILLTQGLPFKEGFLKLFDKVKASKRQIGLVTSANYIDMKENFERNHIGLLESFSYVITIEDVRYPKPNPQPYQMMMQKMACLPTECVVIEDSIPGASAAVGAGANTIMINENIPPLELEQQLAYRAGHHDDILTFLQNNGL